jgi:tyrosyl-tRNA synthetase
VIRLNSRVTLQQMLQREDFRGRIDNQHPIHAHEIQYPIMQGWDSVMVRADVELGGTDQLFNILVGRDFQKEENQAQQVVLTMPILEGLDGVTKMSKSLGNFVGVSEPPADMFGKLMSISDKLMVRYYEVLLGRELPKDANPFEAKKQLAFEIVQTYHSAEVAQRTLADWNARFSQKRLDEADLPTFATVTDESVTVVAAAYLQGFAIQKSRAEVSRLIKQGSVQLDGEKIVDPKSKISLQPGQILRLDKTHAVRIK